MSASASDGVVGASFERDSVAVNGASGGGGGGTPSLERCLRGGERDDINAAEIIAAVETNAGDIDSGDDDGDTT